MSYLRKMQQEVRHFAEAISGVLEIETEIIDEKMEVIGSTGCRSSDYASKWDNVSIWSESNAQISKHLFETRRPLILEDPGTNKLCRNCTEKNCCCYKAGLYYPILLNTTCYGIISLVAFTHSQRSRLIENSFSFMNFTGKMADILASKIQEMIASETLSRTNRYLKAIIESVQEGIIACDGEGIITCFNQAAEKKLSISAQNALGQQIDRIIPESLLISALKEKTPVRDTQVIYRNRHLISNVIPVTESGILLGAVESFNTDETIYRIAHKLFRSDDTTSFDKIIGSSPAVSAVKKQASAISKSPSTVLITGESGTGKELFAKAIHKASHCKDRPFIPVNCGAIPESLLESELFGYEKGAFTGARASGKPGLFEAAAGGTVFLDEIGDLPVSLQVKLLRVLQEKEIRRIGGITQIPVNVRVIAATNQNLEEMVETGSFRKDLYYRLNVIPISIPPLRQHREDIPELVRFLCEKYASLLKKKVHGITGEALDILYEYPWPGNIRELENAIEYAVNYADEDGVITPSCLPGRLQRRTGFSPSVISAEPEEKKRIREMLNSCGTSLQGKKTAAEKLGISLATLYRKIKKYEL